MAESTSVRRVMSELSALDSRTRVIAQKMKLIEKNEQIIGKTLIMHNKKLKELEESISSGAFPGATEADVGEGERRTYAELHSLVSSMEEQVRQNKEMLDKIREDINEMKYVVDMINPIAYVTIDKVENIVDDRISRMKKKK